MQNRIFASLIGIAMVAVATGAPAQTGAPTAASASELPPGEGQATTERVCSACHSPVVITHQRLSGDDWADLVYQMADRGAMASDDELTEIIDYLSRTYPAEGAGSH